MQSNLKLFPYFMLLHALALSISQSSLFKNNSSLELPNKFQINLAEFRVHQGLDMFMNSVTGLTQMKN